MKQFSGFKAEKTFSGEALPVGGYVAKVMGAKVEEYSWGEVLVISFDIAEGDYKDFFSKQYRANPNDDKKWKGNFRLNVPNESNQYFDSQKRAFNNCMWSFEESNKGYHWDWDENKLKGKIIGVLFRNKEFEKTDGTTGWFSECCSVTDATSIREGNFKMPKDKPLANKPAPQTTQTSSAPNADFEEIGDEDLPF